jgi:hypothetical protein
LEANPEETESEPMNQEVPNEDAIVESVRALKKLYGGRYLDVGRRRQPKKRAQGDGWSQLVDG